MATKLAAQIKKNVDEAAELEWEWLLRKMMESPTVSSLALALSSTEEAEKAAPKGQMAPVVVLKDGNGDGVVNVLVHDGTGTLDHTATLLALRVTNSSSVCKCPTCKKPWIMTPDLL